MRLDELSFERRVEWRTTTGSSSTSFPGFSGNEVGSSSGRIMRLVPVLETHNQMNYKMFAQVI